MFRGKQIRNCDYKTKQQCVKMWHILFQVITFVSEVPDNKCFKARCNQILDNNSDFHAHFVEQTQFFGLGQPNTISYPGTLDIQSSQSASNYSNDTL